MIRLAVLRVALFCAASQGAACMTLLVGNEQDLSIRSDPPGAQVQLLRNGRQIGSCPTTPCTMRVRQVDRAVLYFTKAGHDPDSIVLHSSDQTGLSILAFVLNLPTVIVGCLYDLRSDVLYEYTSHYYTGQLLPMVSPDPGTAPGAKSEAGPNRPEPDPAAPRETKEPKDREP